MFFVCLFYASQWVYVYFAGKRTRVRTRVWNRRCRLVTIELEEVCFLFRPNETNRRERMKRGSRIIITSGNVDKRLGLIMLQHLATTTLSVSIMKRNHGRRAERNDACSATWKATCVCELELAASQRGFVPSDVTDDHLIRYVTIKTLHTLHFICFSRLS